MLKKRNIAGIVVFQLLEQRHNFCHLLQDQKRIFQGNLSV